MGRGKDGVVFACEKIVASKLYEAGANRRITNIDTHVGMAAAGLVTDARQLAEIARDEAGTYRSDYGSPNPLALATATGAVLLARPSRPPRPSWRRSRWP